MGAGVGFLKQFDADFDVNPGGFEFGVPGKLLDDADVGPVFDHVGGAGPVLGAADFGVGIVRVLPLLVGSVADFALPVKRATAGGSSGSTPASLASAHIFCA